MPDVEHPAFGFLRWPPEKPERTWQPLPCKRITIESSSNWPSFTVSEVTLFPDGKATMHNSYDEEFVTKRIPDFEGRFEASVARESFGLLCYMIERADFWHLERNYTKQVSDCPWNIITVESEQQIYSLRDHCQQAPVDVVAFELAFQQIASQLFWQARSRQ